MPPLAEFRPQPGESLLETDCRACHTSAELATLSGDWTHPIRPVADHLECTDCHVAQPHDALHPPPLPRGDYKAEACYACHQQTEVERHWLSRHAAHVQCRECHSAHSPTHAAVPRWMLPAKVREVASRSYDWQLSNAQCIKCHNLAGLTLSLDRGFVALNTANYHELHLVRGQSLCIECHAPHGSTQPALLRRTLLDHTPMTYLPRPDGGTCTTVCHGVEHARWNYTNQVF